MQRLKASILSATFISLFLGGPAAPAARDEVKPSGATHAASSPAAQAKALPAAPAATAPRIRWRPWSDAAFKEAADSGRLVLLDISAPWDHHDQVMSELTYADPNVVGLVESAFVPVRVDSDERPDVFARYGMGGWPTTAVLLSDAEPMYYPDKDQKVIRAGGTFYPPDAFVAYFSQLASYYARNKEMVERVTKNIDDAILAKKNVEQGEVTADTMDAIVGKILDVYTKRPLVPVPGEHHPDFDMVRLTLFDWFLKSERKVLDAGLDHLTDLARGGIYDRLGGGFFRYAHDSMYIVPAFEKVPSINAEAILAYLQAFEVSGNGRFLVFAEGTIDHVLKHGIDPATKSFRGAMAAGASAADDGDYYTWTEDEVKAALTPEEFGVVSVAWNIFPMGEMLDIAPKNNVIFLAEGPKALAVQLKIEEKRAEEILESARVKLLALREKRREPPVDPRTFADSSALMASAFLQADRSLHRPELAKQALASLAVLLARCRTDEDLIAHACDPAGGTRGREFFLSDQANVTNALIDAHEQSGSATYLTEARGLADKAYGVFRDPISGSLSDRQTDPNAQGLMAWPMKDLRDNMELVKALVRLGHLSGEKSYFDKARRTLESWADEVGAYEEHGSPYAYASQMLLTPPLEILVAADPNDAASDKTRERALGLYHPWRIVRQYGLDAGKAAIAKRGLKPMGVPQVAFCVGGDCAGPYPGADPLRKHLDAFLSKGSASGGAKSRPADKPSGKAGDKSAAPKGGS